MRKHLASADAKLEAMQTLPAAEAEHRDKIFGVTLNDPMTVIVRVRPDQAPYISEREWHPTQEIRHLTDGGIEQTFCAGGSFEIERWILGWGDAMDVIAPQSLRESLQLKCHAMSKIYRPSKRMPENRIIYCFIVTLVRASFSYPATDEAFQFRRKRSLH